MKYIDTHSHLYSPKFAEDQDEVIERCKEVLHAVFLPNIDSESIDAMHQLTDKDPDFFLPMMGLHPSHVKEGFEKEIEIMESWLNRDDYTYYGIGETGIDLYWDKTTLPLQQESLQIHIEWAKARRLPIILHARNAIDEVADLIEKNHDESLTGIFHCFDGTPEQAQRICEFGNFKLGIGGVVTYKKSTLPAALEHVSLDYIVLETDSPYLAPVPMRGRRNESSYTQFVGEKLAELYGKTHGQIAEITNRNALEVFHTAGVGID